MHEYINTVQEITIGMEKHIQYISTYSWLFFIQFSIQLQRGGVCLMVLSMVIILLAAFEKQADGFFLRICMYIYNGMYPVFTVTYFMLFMKAKFSC